MDYAEFVQHGWAELGDEGAGIGHRLVYHRFQLGENLREALFHGVLFRQV